MLTALFLLGLATAVFNPNIAVGFAGIGLMLIALGARLYVGDSGEQ